MDYTTVTMVPGLHVDEGQTAGFQRLTDDIFVAAVDGIVHVYRRDEQSGDFTLRGTVDTHL